MMVQRLFIGGIAHGKYLAVPEGITVFSIVKSSKRTVDISTVSTPESLRIDAFRISEDYIRREIVDKNYKIEVYAHRGLTGEQMYDMYKEWKHG